MNHKLYKSLFALSVLVCAGCTLKDAADCAPGQTQCKDTKDGTGVYNVCSEDAEYVMKTTCMLGCGDNDMCRSLNACDKDEQLCRGIEGGLALVWTCKNQQASITPCTGVCDGNVCHDGGSQGMCLGTEKPFCAQTVAVWCENNYWQAQSCDEASEDCIEGKCVSRIQPVDTGDDTGVQSSKIEGTVFHVYTGKGFLDYQNLSNDEIQKLTKMVIHGDINLYDAQTSVINEEDGSCSWPDWMPLNIPDGMEVMGEDNAAVCYLKGNVSCATGFFRCDLKKAFFGEMNNSELHDISFEIDYEDEGEGGILINQFNNSRMYRINYQGAAVFRNRQWSYGLIAKASNFKIEHVSVYYDAILSNIKYIDSSVGYLGGLVGNADCEGTGCQVEYVSLIVNEGLRESNGKAPHFGGIIGWLEGKFSIANSVVELMYYSNYSNFTGGLIAQGQNLDALNVDNVYVQFEIKKVIDNSGGIIGRWYQADDKAETHHIKNFVIRITNPDDGWIAGVYGKIQTQNSTPPKVTIENGVVIADKIKGGIVSSVDHMPDLKNVVIASPQTGCDKMIVLNNDSGAALCTASVENVYYYREDAACTEVESCFKSYSTKAEADDIVTTFKKDAPGWRVENYEIGDAAIPVPVFSVKTP